MYRSRITIQRQAAPTQSASGGLVPVSTTFSKWAKVENRTGSVSFDRAQRDWNYDYKITIRYEPSLTVLNGDTIVYSGKTLQVKEVVPKDEGEVREVVLRCSTVE